MRTNIVIDDALMAEAQRLTGGETKKQVVDEALRLLIQIYQQKEIRQLRGKLTWTGNLDELRSSRFEPTD
jgi:Arc/MetJ family transcription regulator